MSAAAEAPAVARPLWAAPRALSRQGVFALAVDGREALCVPLSVTAAEGASAEFSGNMDASAREACSNARRGLVSMGLLSKDAVPSFYVPSLVRRVSGPSLGLAAAAALLRWKDAEGPLVWATGEVTPFGTVLPVGRMAVKLSHPALAEGLILVPRAAGTPQGGRLSAVDSLEEVRRCLMS